MTTTTDATTFAQIAEPLRSRIDAGLVASLDFSDDRPATLLEAMRYSLLSPGKRLRPILVLLAAEACGSTTESALPAACAVEMVHAYSLIHDDLPAMDDDDLRRGRPTCHKAYGEAMAILAGDALLTRAFEVVAKQVQPPQVAARCVADLAVAAGAMGMVGGQVDDLAAEERTRTRDDFASEREGALQMLKSIHTRKTGAMFTVALRLGGWVAEATDSQMAALTDYGDHLGLAFQITDDLLDASGEEATTGKRVGKDIQRGKLTFPGLMGVKESRSLARQEVDRACRALVPLRTSSGQLHALAQFVLERDR